MVYDFKIIIDNSLLNLKIDYFEMLATDFTA